MSADIRLGRGQTEFQVKVDVVPPTFDQVNAISYGTRRRIVLLAIHPDRTVQVLLREPYPKTGAWMTLPPYTVLPGRAGILVNEPFDIVDLRRAITSYLLPVSSTSEHGRAIHRWFREELGRAATQWLSSQPVQPSSARAAQLTAAQHLTLTPDQIVKITREDLARALTGAAPVAERGDLDSAIKRTFEKLRSR